MKTKHLVAMALPLVFTACSQEELVNENTQTTTSRKVVENVVFNFGVDSESRMAFDGIGYTWEKGDKFGACLMDEMVGTMDSDFSWDAWFKQFKLVDYIHSNYPFTRQENKSWTNAEAVMQEGNYFFYYPYNYNLGGKRTPIRMNVPTVQYLSDEEATYKVLDEQMFVAYAPIVADPSKGDHETVTNLTMEPLLAFPAFNITNNTGTPFTISRIAIGGKDGDNAIGFPTVFEVKPAVGSFDGFNYYVNPETTVADKRQSLLDIVTTNDDDLFSSTVSVVFGENGKILENSKSFTSYVMLPAMDKLKGVSGDIDGLKLYIYTNKGLVTVPLNTNEGGSDTNNDDIKVQNALTKYMYNDGHITYITLDEKAFATPSKMDVASTRDLEDLVEWNKNTQSTITAVLSQNVTITKKVYDVLAANNKLTLNLTASTSDVKVLIPEDAPANAFDEISFNNIKDTQNVETVENYAKVNLTKNILSSANNFVNYGDMTWTSNQTVGNFKNKGQLSLNKKDMSVVVSSTFENYGTFNVLANAVVSELENYKEMTINKDVIFTSGEFRNLYNSLDEYGVLNVNGTLKGELTSNATVIVGASGYINVDSESTNNTNEIVDQNGVILYSSSIQNSGVISGIMNSGTIVMVTKEARLTSSSYSHGYVNNTICSPYVAKVSNETIYAEVNGDSKASEIAKIVAESNAAELRLSGNLTIDPKEDESVVLVKGQQSNFEVVAIGNLNIIPSKNGAEIGFKNIGNKYAGFTVNPYVTSKVATGSIFSVGTVKNNGKIIVEANATVWSDSAKPNGVELYGFWTQRK